MKSVWLFIISILAVPLVLIVMLASFALGRGIGFAVTALIVLFGLGFARRQKLL